MRVAVALLVLTAGSVALRTGALDAGFWIDEAIAVGIASHDPGEIPALLRQDGLWLVRDRGRGGLLVGAAGFALAWLASQITLAWSPRYLFVLFGPVVVALACALARRRSRGLHAAGAGSGPASLPARRRRLPDAARDSG
jgi:hypothetical protein